MSPVDRANVRNDLCPGLQPLGGQSATAFILAKTL